MQNLENLNGGNEDDTAPSEFPSDGQHDRWSVWPEPHDSRYPEFEERRKKITEILNKPRGEDEKASRSEQKILTEWFIRDFIPNVVMRGCFAVRKKENESQ